MQNVLDPAFVDASLDSRSVTFENPTGARGAGGSCARRIAKGRRTGVSRPARGGARRHRRARHAAPRLDDVPARAAREDARAADWRCSTTGPPSRASRSVPRLLRPAARPPGRRTQSALTSAQEGRGFNAYFPMPFARHVRVELDERRAHVQRPLLPDRLHAASRDCRTSAGYLHVSFRRENPTALREDFVIADGLRGPGRFLGCNVGMRVLDRGDWYGEGEVKIYRDGDDDLPTICGTGLEDYVGSAWGLGAHCGALRRRAARRPTPEPRASADPDFVGFYRWHLPDPVMFAADLRVTIQQIGAAFFLHGQEAEIAAYERTNPVAGEGWLRAARGRPRVGHRRARRRLLRDGVRLLPRAAARAAPRHRRGARRHRAQGLGASPIRSEMLSAVMQPSAPREMGRPRQSRGASRPRRRSASTARRLRASRRARRPRCRSARRRRAKRRARAARRARRRRRRRRRRCRCTSTACAGDASRRRRPR